MHLYNRAIVACTAAILMTACTHTRSPDSGPGKVVAEFVSAFNAKDASTMRAMVTQDVQWLSIDGDTVTVEAQGREALVSAMADYFKACPSCRSSISKPVGTSQRVSTIEVAQWDGAEGPKSQEAMAIYELQGPLIRRVYYFPAETD